MRFAVLIALAACLGACGREPLAPASPQQQAPVDANALTADGWGPLRIGMTRDEVTAALGPDANPGAVGGPDPDSCDLYRPERAPDGMLVMVENGMLTRITLMRQSEIKTDRGFGLGDAAAAIKAAYGAEAVVAPHRYQDPPAEYITAWRNLRPAANEYVQDQSARGVAFEINGEGVVAFIHAGGPSIQYVEGCS